MVEDLDEKLFKEKIFNFDEDSDAPMLINKDTIIEFWVTWCPHCKAMVPRYEMVSEEFPQISCYRIELEKHPDLAKLFNVASFPTFIFITSAGRVEKYVGEITEEELAHMVKEVFCVKPQQ